MRRALLIPTAVLTLALSACQSPEAPAGVRIEGNREVDTDDLLTVAKRELESFDKTRRLADAFDAAHSMEIFLADEGYPEAQVDYAVRGNDMVFTIQEGPQARLRRVCFEGIRSFPRDQFEDFFDFPPSGFLGFGPVLYQRNRVLGAASSVEDFYRAKGFVRAEVEEPQIVWNAARTEIDLVVRVQEGRRYRIREVTIEGADRSYLQNLGAPGRVFAVGTANGIAREVRRKIQSEGYPKALVRGRARIDDATATASIHITVDRGPRLRLRCINFEGQDRTSEAFMRGRFDIKAGQLMRRRALDQGIGRIYRTGAFETIRTEIRPVGGDLADFDVELQEADPYRLSFEVGYGSYELLRGRVTFEDFNLFGWGRYLRADVRGSIKDQGVDLLVEDPWILGENNLLSVRGGIRRREEPFYTARGFELELRVERRLSKTWLLRAGYLLRAEEAFDIAPDIPPDALEESQQLQRTAGLWALGRYDTRDHLFVPTQGILAEVGVLWSEPALGASLNFVELTGDFSYYWPLRDVGVFGFNVKGATKQPLGDTENLPIQERYFRGGPTSVRSFGQDELTPVDMFGNGVGGLTFGEAHAEFRRRLVENLWAAVFYDVGVVSLDPFSFDGAWGHGVGAGLRYHTPVGPIRADVAYNPGRLWGATNRWQLHVGFGFSF